MAGARPPWNSEVWDPSADKTVRTFDDMARLRQQQQQQQRQQQQREKQRPRRSKSMRAARPHRRAESVADVRRRMEAELIVVPVGPGPGPGPAPHVAAPPLSTEACALCGKLSALLRHAPTAAWLPISSAARSVQARSARAHQAVPARARRRGRFGCGEHRGMCCRG
jgi:hypothetical protein